MKHVERILILDFGSQTTQLIARRLRELGVYCEIAPFSIPANEALTPETCGIIFSGSPASVNEPNSPHPDPAIFESKRPMLGICYGMQLIGEHFGSHVVPGLQGEFGRASISVRDNGAIWNGLGSQVDVWMSHGDHIEKVQEPLIEIGGSEAGIVSAVAHRERPIYGVQFHPEVTHTPRGKDILHNFAFDVCGCRGGWSMESFIDSAIAEIRARVGKSKVICAVSGGLDSTVAAVLIGRAIGQQLISVHVDTGLGRKGEREEIEQVFAEHEHIRLNV
ncbi:MAG: glutamine-hydrolyzing GMP synthase, partial [Calditrichota bacterium]